MKVDRQIVIAVAYGFAIGLAVGIVLESSGVLQGLDRLVARHVQRQDPEPATAEAPVVPPPQERAGPANTSPAPATEYPVEEPV